MKLRTATLWISALLLIAALAGLVYLGTFTRYLADDFCMAGDAIHIGLLNMLSKWYTTWTGRFMFIIGTGLFGLGGPKFAAWVPPVAALIWLVGICWSIHPIIKRLAWPKPVLLSVVAGSLVLLVLLSTIPNLFQSFFWQDGMVNYSLPLIGLTFCCGIILHAWLEKANMLFASFSVGILAFLSGGFTEASTAMEITLFALALLLSLTCRDRATRRRLATVLSAALLGALLAMLVVFIAPGNQTRLQIVGGQSGHPGIFRILTFSFRNMVYIYGKFFLRTPFWAILSIILPLIAGWIFSTPSAALPEKINLAYLWKQNWFRSMLFIGVSAIILVTAACAPVVFAVNAYPEDRTIIIMQFAVILSVIFISASLGIGFRQLGLLPGLAHNLSLNRILLVGILIMIVITAGVSILNSANRLPTYHSYQEMWDQRAALIQQAARSGETTITVPGRYSLFAVADLSEDPGNWVNRCMAYYYGVSEIIGK